MADPKIVKEWLHKADEDLNFAKINLEEGNNFYAQICFHFHQAVEKFLKSFIVAYDLEFEKTHNLMNLLTVCSLIDTSLLSFMEECERINTAYIDTRYPVHWPTDYTKDKASKFRSDADKVAYAIKTALEKGGYV
ncbi:MAG: HEPN domain-containing protein [Thermodesulfovibrionales bacterium]